jgi:hypothetical protein
MPSVDDVSVELVKEYLVYEPDTGVIYWIKSPAKNVYAGEVAGCNKATRKDKNGNLVSYGYIRIGNQNIPSARIAWVLLNGEWPNGRVKFNDGNPLNLKADNLSLSRSIATKSDDNKLDSSNPEYYRLHRKAFKTDYKDSDLQRRFGITLFDYSQMLLAQNGKCAICKGTDGGTRNGEPKALAVDHDHETGKVRGLLCEACNQAIGKMKEEPKIILSSLDYLCQHKQPSELTAKLQEGVKNLMALFDS